MGRAGPSEREGGVPQRFAAGFRCRLEIGLGVGGAGAEGHPVDGDLLGGLLGHEVLAEDTREDRPQRAPQVRLQHDLRLPQHFLRNVLAQEVHAHTVSEVVAIIAGGVVSLPRKDRLELVHDKGVELVPLPQRRAHGDGDPRRAEARLAGRVVVDVTAEIVLLAIDHQASVPNALQHLRQDPGRDGPRQPVREVVQVKRHLPLPAAQAERQEVRGAHAGAGIEVQGLDGARDELVGGPVREVRLALGRAFLRAWPKMPQLAAKDADDLAKGQASTASATRTGLLHVSILPRRSAALPRLGHGGIPRDLKSVLEADEDAWTDTDRNLQEPVDLQHRPHGTRARPREQHVVHPDVDVHLTTALRVDLTHGLGDSDLDELPVTAGKRVVTLPQLLALRHIKPTSDEFLGGHRPLPLCGRAAGGETPGGALGDGDGLGGGCLSSRAAAELGADGLQRRPIHRVHRPRRPRGRAAASTSDDAAAEQRRERL
mmetsp:Transcript_6133/g.15216  ORF Transcript_6133/g.15216 Transcript_6133/m.15216 type:complete len:486 (+) Transcript_6133:81-1538(+)